VLEKSIVITIILILYFILIKRFVKRYAPENLIILSLLSLSFGIYLYCVFNNIYISEIYQIFLFTFMFFVPLLASLLQNRNVILKRAILYLRIKFEMYLSDYEEAKKLIIKMIEINGRKGNLYYLLGICYKKTNDFINARDSFALAVELDKRDYLSYYELGLILEETNKKDVAIIMFNNALRIKPDFYDAAENLGISFSSQGRFEEAIKVYTNALEYHPKSYELYYNIAMLEFEIGDYENSQINFLKAAENYPKLYSAYYNIGRINYLKGDYEKAIKFFKLARSSTIYGGRAYYDLAKVYASNKEYEKAMSCLEYALQIEERYLFQAKNELVFENMKDKILCYENDVLLAEENLRDRNDYMKELDYISKKRSKLDSLIEQDIKKDELS
jgi:tetratricopeptide (TPR) repeat protein